MLMMLARFRATGKKIPADAHDAGPVPGNGTNRFQLMLMMLARFWATGKRDSS